MSVPDVEFLIRTYNDIRLLRAFRQVAYAHLPVNQQRRRAVRGRQQLPRNDRSCRRHDAGTPLRPPRPATGRNGSVLAVGGRTVLPRKRWRHGSPLVAIVRERPRHDGTCKIEIATVIKCY